MENAEIACKSTLGSKGLGSKGLGDAAPDVVPPSPRALARLLRALTPPGAYACADLLAPETRIRVVMPGLAADAEPVAGALGPGGLARISLGSILVDRSLAEACVSMGLARWQRGGASRVRRLYIDAAGHGYLARLNAGAGEAGFLAQHLPLVQQALAFEPGAGTVQVNAAESPLAWLARRKDRDGRAFISAVQLACGERLRAELTRACLLPQVTARWGGVTGGNGSAVPFAENVAAARQRVRAAMRACGPEMAGLLMDVCGFLKGLEQIEQERGWARRSAKFVLSEALDRLCRHYGMEASATGRASQGKIRNWGTPDYRPSL